MSGQSRSVSIHSSRFFSPGGEPAGPVGPGGDEFDESEIWGSPVEPGPAEPGLNPLHRARPGRRKPERAGAPVTAPCSLPVNIPDWSKILGGEYKGKEWSEAEAEEEEEEEGVRIPRGWSRRTCGFGGTGPSRARFAKGWGGP
uniref:Uncharacterized protein n=1 Tax=Ananas comosus var. bracteatus TaxID=296719 RepID=A0A6V7NL39_ANACO|nr:unnamed protein product [Ananas comosus var. bracteatus]